MSDEIKRGIIEYLTEFHNGKWVNIPVAIKPFPIEAVHILEELIKENIIERKYIYHNGSPFPLVRYISRSWDRPTLRIIDGDKA